MTLRSLLFVPGDRPDRVEKAASAGADALILDLEDSVAPARKDVARDTIRIFLGRSGRKVALYVRVNPLSSDFIDDDLSAVLSARPDALVLPKAEGAMSVRALIGKMGEVLPILPIATETAAAIFQLGSYAEVAAHLSGLTWGAEDLPAAIGATSSREGDGRFTPPYELTRSLTLFGAHAAGVAAIETVYPFLRDLDGLKAYALRAARDGFTGMMAVHPSQVAILNAAFTPSPEEVAAARAIVDAFAAGSGQGALQFDGRMIDAPHLKQARRLLERAGIDALRIPPNSTSEAISQW